MGQTHKDLTGQRFGMIEAIGMEKKGSLYHVVGRCDCGVVKTYYPENLRRGTSSSCGCRPRNRKPPLEDLTGRRFGYLEVLRMEQVGKTEYAAKRGVYFAVCRCLNCGKEEHPVLAPSLKRGATTSCGCRRDQYARNSGENNPGFKGFKGISANFWRGYELRARERGLAFAISKEYAWGLFEKQGQRCALSGQPLNFSAGKNSRTSASLDRIDSSVGYVEGNVQWVHKHINIMKNVYTMDYFVDLCEKVAAHVGRGSRAGTGP